MSHSKKYKRKTNKILFEIINSMISFVYFDVGGVVIKDFSGTNKWNEMMADLGICGNDVDVFKNFWKLHRRDIAVGTMDLNTGVRLLKQEIPIRVPKNYSMIDDFVNRFEPNPTIWPVIAEIHKQTRIGLLTDMYVGMLDAIIHANLFPKEQWDSVIDSSIVHCKKPERQIFELAREKAGVPNDQIFFIDNVEENTKAARDFGWQTCLYDSKNPEASSKLLLETFRMQQ